jgi:NAD(P)-dependent dehydrogenase (short-subunit alcohol dehydrogenase family)
MNMGISFLVGREAARRIVVDDSDPATYPAGTCIFTGATGGLRGKPPFIAFAQGKAGVRWLAQSMAREFGPKGSHFLSPFFLFPSACSSAVLRFMTPC